MPDVHAGGVSDVHTVGMPDLHIWHRDGECGMAEKRKNISEKPFGELVGTKKFVEIFKNTIRDYYTYGYKSYSQFKTGKKQLRARWMILADIFSEKWTFSEEDKGRNRITVKTVDREAGRDVNDLYFLHHINEWGDYINCLFDLDPASRLRDGIKGFPALEEELCTIETRSGPKLLVDENEIEYAIIQNRLKELEIESRDYSVNKWTEKGLPETETGSWPVRVNRLLYIWTGWTKMGGRDPRFLFKNLSNRTAVMGAFGLIGNLKYSPAERDIWTSMEWDRYLSGEYGRRKTSIGADAQRSPDSGRDYPALSRAPGPDAQRNLDFGRDYWYKSSLTMENLVWSAAGFPKQEDGGDINSILESILAMCRFFSDYYPLGAVGTMLEKRILPALGPEKSRPECFRFKHNYIQKPMYDYHLIDLWIAIEKEYYCRLKYAHATNLRKMEDFGVPLEIRVSVLNGREYLLYYQIWEKKIKSMRIEFIDEIDMYSKVPGSVRLYRKTIQKDKKKKIEQTKYIKTMPPIKADDLYKQLSLAKKMLPYLWGMEVSECIVDDQWESRLRTYKIFVSHDTEKEHYIHNRMSREKRSLADVRQKDSEADGLFEIKGTCFPTKEFRTWIRSYYRRVHGCDPGMADNGGEDDFSLAEDVESMWKLYYKEGFGISGEAAEEQEKDQSSEILYGYLVEESREKRGTGGKNQVKSSIKAPGHEGHEELFNEFFSKYAIAAGNALLRCSGKKVCSRAAFKRALEEEVRKNRPFYKAEEGNRDGNGLPEDRIHDIVEELTNYIAERELIGLDGKTRFISKRKDYLYDFLPITGVEARWLLTVLQDPLAEVFFDEKLLRSGVPDKLRKCLCGERSCLPDRNLHSYLDHPPDHPSDNLLDNSLGLPAGERVKPSTREQALKNVFHHTPYRTKPFHMEYINYFDRHNVKGLKTRFENKGNSTGRSSEEIRLLRLIYEAMQSGRKIHICYKNWKGENKKVVCSPSWLEYSRRDNVFRVWYYNRKLKRVMKINVPRILSAVQMQDTGYDLHEEQKITDKAIKASMKSIAVEFCQGSRNLPDRILTEFSLWEKQCTYDSDTGKYTMTINYPKFDEKEILVRLMGYGPYVRVVNDEDGYILNEIKERIRIQRDILQTIEYEDH